MEQARCKDEDIDTFFPSNGEGSSAAKAICDKCKVVNECFDFAIRTGQRHGIWGGISPIKLRKVRKLRRRKRKRK